jgi:S1-C subfamily serine protease
MSNFKKSVAICCLLLPVDGALAIAQVADRASAEPLASKIEAVLKRVTPSVVGLWYGEQRQVHITGVIISQDGMIATCGHLSAKVGEVVEVRLTDGRKSEGKVLAKLSPQGDEVRDLALVKMISGNSWPSVEVGTSHNLSDNDSLLLLGLGDTGLFNKLGDEPPLQVRLGTKLFNAKAHSDVMYTTISAITGGDSGGPLFDLGGCLVGTLVGGGDLAANSRFTTVDLLRRDWRSLAGDVPVPPLPVGPRPVLSTAATGMAQAIRGVRDSVVEVRSDERWVGVGVIVERGLILTKASELGPNLRVILRNQIPAIAKLVATDPDRDTALLRISADLTDGIQPVEWKEEKEQATGTLVGCVTPSDFSPLFGVVSVSSRRIEPMMGGLAATLKDAAGGVEVEELIDDLNQGLRPVPHMLRVGDIITEINGRSLRNKQDFYDWKIGPPPAFICGEIVPIKFRRAGIVQEISYRMRPGYTVADQLLTPYSYRHTGFPQAFACDFAARPELCGSLVVNAKAHAIGLLIAKAPFVESFVLPTREVNKSLDKLKASVKRN